MLFNSLTFIVFFAIVLALHYMPFKWKTKKFNLLFASYIFYAAWNPPLVVLLWISTIVDWFAAKNLSKAPTKSSKRLWLGISLLANLGMLGFFKYGGFFLQNFVAVSDAYGYSYTPAAPDIILPMGISFYTFQTLSYTIDVYRGKLKPWNSFLDYAMYVTFFPQLVAGPIVRAGDFLPQCREEKRANRSMFSWGLCLITLGLFQKIVLADGFLAGPADEVFGAAGPLNPLDAWVGTLAFSAQIFSDFAGYSTCAIGAALCLGFSLPNNFLFPYAALGFSDFWRRWHITLSTWLRDYLYISLGGNRVGKFRLGFNLMLTMVLGGLWHGAAWTFVAWGALHGIYLIIERFLKGIFGGQDWVKTLPVRILLILITHFLVLMTWVFFRSSSFEEVGRMMSSMFGLAKDGAQILTTFDIAAVLIINAFLISIHFVMRNTTHEKFLEKVPWWFTSIVWFIMLVAVILKMGGGDAFIYFQF